MAGDSRRGFAAGCVASAGFLVVGHLEGPTVYDGLAWVLVSWLVLRILRAGEERLWIAVGPTVGIGMEAKQTLPLLLVGLTVGFLLNGQRRLFSSRWLWLGALVALLGWAPNLVWQATNGWPSRAMESSLRAEHSGLGYAIKYPFITLLAMGVLIAPVWLAGAWVLWVEPRFRRYRAFAVAFTLGLVLLWVVIPDRFYYLVGIYPVLFAAGSIVTGEVVDGSRGFFRRHVAHRWLWRSRGFAIGILVVDFVVFLPLALPVLPASAVAAANLQKINYNLGEEIGWPELVHEVADVWRSLPADERDPDRQLRRGGRIDPVRVRVRPPDRVRRTQLVLVLGSAEVRRDHHGRGRTRPRGSGAALPGLSRRGAGAQRSRRRQRRARPADLDLHRPEGLVGADVAGVQALWLGRAR